MNQSKFLLYTIILVSLGVAYTYFTENKEIDSKEIEGVLVNIEDNSAETMINEKHKEFRRADFGVLNYPMKKRPPKKILVEENSTIHALMVGDIMYCEKVGNSVKIVGKEKKVNTTLTLKELKDKINDPYFIYDELNSFIINFDFVEQYKPQRADINKNTYKHYIIMNDEEEIPLPKGKVSSFKKEWKNYINNFE